MASDTDQGSKTVQIGGQEVMLKNKAVFKTSTGNEAATKSFGMSVVTHQIQGKASFLAWSMDVKFEGENVPRHLDLMGQNESSDPTSPLPHPYSGAAASPETIEKCKKMKSKIVSKWQELKERIGAYDPEEDAKGGHRTHVGGISKPFGHYQAIENLQGGLGGRSAVGQKDRHVGDLEKFYKTCAGSGVNIDRKLRQKIEHDVSRVMVKPPGMP